MEGGVDDNDVNVDDDDAGMEGGVDDNNVNVDDDVCDASQCCLLQCRFHHTDHKKCIHYLMNYKINS